MSVLSTTHVNFRGDARAALEFYRSVFGGALTIVTYGDLGAASEPSEADQVMWGQVAAENGFRIMAFDVPAVRPWSRGESSFFESVRGTEVSEIVDLWSRLVDGATVLTPLEPSTWAPLYGMLTDRFGVTWVLDVAAPYTG